jgi:hypothetical protein
MDDDQIKEEVAQTIYDQCRLGDNYEILATSISVLKLRQNMVWEDESIARVIIAVTTEKRKSRTVVVVKTLYKNQELAAKARLPIWHIYQHGTGKPFVMILPQPPKASLLPNTGGSSVPPAHDAAGIVPVWMPPRRIM